MINLDFVDFQNAGDDAVYGIPVMVFGKDIVSVI